MTNQMQTQITLAQIMEAEARLRKAQLDDDVQALDELISPDLLFTDFTGHLASKADDLAMHEAHLLQLTTLEASEEHIQLHPGFAVVSVLIHLVGTWQGAPVDQHMRYTRVWAPGPNGSAQIVAGHMSELHA